MPDRNSRLMNGLTVLTLGLCFITFVVLLWWIYRMYDRPQIVMAAPNPEFELFFEDTDLTAWIEMNNTFGKDPNTWSESQKHWSGLMFQLGTPKAWDATAESAVLGEVCIDRAASPGTACTPTGDTVCYPRTDFETHKMWINIVARGMSSVPTGDPMTADGVDQLFITDAAGNPVPIRNYFTPYRGGITFWENRFSGYQLKSDPPGIHRGLRVTARREPQMKVEVWKDPGPPPTTPLATFSDACRIRVLLDPDIDHGNTKNPPQR